LNQVLTVGHRRGTSLPLMAAKKARAKKTSRSATSKPGSIDAYLSRVAGPKREALERLRALLRTLLPKAEECISYGLPAFRLEGKVVAGFAATAKGCSYYPFSGATLKALSSELEGYTMTAGALHFEPEQPLPRALVRKLVATRRAED
jgi:uncharacterized protein YdhG (YjbR/CyaY superfamily)